MANDLPLANMFTLGVRDFHAQRDFYRRLGWPLVLDTGDFAVFELRGALLALFPTDQLAADARTSPDLSRDGIRFSVIISVEDAADVDRLATRVREAGGTLTKPPTDAEFFEGRDAYFSDPEGNFWEIAWAAPDNPVVLAARRAAGLQPQPRGASTRRHQSPSIGTVSSTVGSESTSSRRRPGTTT